MRRIGLTALICLGAIVIGGFYAKSAVINLADYTVRQPLLAIRDEIARSEGDGGISPPIEAALPPAKKAWELVTDAAPFDPRDGAFVTSFKGYIWLTNGYNPKEIPNPIYRSKNGKDWEIAVAETPWPRRHLGGFVVLHDRLFMIGGDFQTDVWSSTDGINWQKEPDVPWGKRYNPYIGVFDNKIWVMGGQTFDHKGGEWCDKPYCISYAFNDVWSSSDGKTWTQVTEHAAWEPRSLISSFAVHDNAMWIMGGGIREIVPFNPSGALADTRIAYSDVWRSTDGKKWENVTYRAPWEPRTHVGNIGFDNYLIVEDGSLGKQGNLGSDTWASKDGKDWTRISDPGAIPHRHASSLVVHNGELFLIAGLLHNDVWKLKAGALSEVK